MASDNGADHIESTDSGIVANGADARTSFEGHSRPIGPPQKAIDDVLYSDIGVNTLLNRLKQSIASARDFATFLKKRSSLEEDHAQGLKKLCKSTHETVRRPDNRSDSYSLQFDRVLAVHERMADNGMQFALSVHQMHEDLMELSANMDRGRKQWKGTGLAAEKKVQDAESVMERAKSKYDSLAEEYDRVRTGDKGSSRGFLKKSGPQHEEDLLRKVQAADADYAAKVQAAQSQRQELLATHRPQTIKALQELIAECDSALTLQLQKFAAFNEKLLLGNGIIISPVPTQEDGPGSQARSLRDIVSSINNEQDLANYIAAQSLKVPARVASMQYHKHPTLAPAQQIPSAPRRSMQINNLPHQASSFSVQPSQSPSVQHHPADPIQPYPPGFQQGYSQSYGRAPEPNVSSAPSRYPNQAQQPSYGTPDSPPQHSLPHLPVMTPPPHVIHPSQPSPPPHANPHVPNDLPPLKPVFGQDLEYLFRRDGSAVPIIVYQCIQAVDLFGLDVEGIYRLSGNAAHINHLKAIFDHDPSHLDFRNPSHFSHDISIPSSLLKLFFRDLRDPLFTSANYTSFINAARIEDATVRRDALHAIVNALPDPNYATLRALVLHLHRVAEHEGRNRMSVGNLAICWAPTLMGLDGGGGGGGGGAVGMGDVRDAGLQVRVVETVLENTYRIFDED